MTQNVAPKPTPSVNATQTKTVPCRFCGTPRTTVIDRRGARVLRKCDACKLSWTSEEEQKTPRSAR